MDFFDEWEDTLNHRIDTTIEKTNRKPELNNYKERVIYKITAQKKFLWELEESFYNRFQKSK
jgi:hypothetical protein